MSEVTARPQKSTSATGQALVEYVLTLALVSAVLGMLAGLLRGAIAAVRLRFLLGLAWPS
ncbi:MAG: hypothetical protein ACM3XZ_00580 [Betaproteobacteria bacterium]